MRFEKRSACAKQILSSLFCALVCSVASAEPVYPLVVLESFPGTLYSSATDINNLNQAVGYQQIGTDEEARTEALLWQDNQVINLGTLGGMSAEASSINNLDMIVGGAQIAGGSAYRAFIWQSGVMQDLGILPGYTDSRATSINDNGQVVGWCSSFIDNTWYTQAFLWENGVMTPLSTPEDQNSFASDINANGVIVGLTGPRTGGHLATVWSGGEATFLSDVDWVRSGARAINNAGQIVGDFLDVGGETHPFLYDDGVFTDLNVGPLAGRSNSANGINDAGQVIIEGPAGAYVWQNGLATVLGQGQIPINNPNAINNAGVVAGNGLVENKILAVELFSPYHLVPEPSSVIMFGMGLIAVASVFLGGKKRHA